MQEPNELESLLAERDQLLERLRLIARIVGGSRLARDGKRKILALCTDGDPVDQKTAREAIRPVTAARFMTLMDSVPTWRTGCADCDVGRDPERQWFCRKCGILY